jgi:uncharacterized protein YuzE
MRNIVEFRIIYDRDSDVLYITTPYRAAERGIEDETGLVWRYDGRGQLLGCTILDFAGHWYPERGSQLATRLAKSLELPLVQVENVLAHAVDTENNA